MNRQKPVRSRSAAFTLVELLVVITIIGMLMALLLPAVQAAREAGRRAVCMNNEKNLSLAMLNFETSRKFFPGYVNQQKITTTEATFHPVSWVVMLLPYLDRKDLYDAWAETPDPWGVPGKDRCFKSLKILTCPSDPPSSTAAGTTWLAYVCNRGINGIDNPAMGVCMNQSGFQGGHFNESGYQMSPVRVSQDYISSHDGSTTTLLLAESILINPTPPTPGLVHPRLKPEWTSNGPGGAETTGLNLMETDVGFEWGTFSDYPKVSDKVLSYHSGGVHVSFCDGHQQFIQTDIDVRTYIHLMTPYDRGCPDNSSIGYCNLPSTYVIPLPDVLDEANY